MFYLMLGLLACTSGDLDSGAIQEQRKKKVLYIGMNVLIELESISAMSELTDSNLGEFDLYEHYGKPIVIQLAAEWCGPCHTAGGFAEQFMADWAVEDLLWVTIIIENDQGQAPGAEDLAEWVSSKGITNAVVLAGSRDLLDPTGLDGFPLTSWPTFVLLDRDMKVFHGFSGWSEEYLTMKLTDLKMQEIE